MARLLRGWKWLSLACAVVVGLWGIGLIAFAQNVTNQPDPNDEKTDAIVALTGELNRLSTGISLLREGFADQLFISGVYRGVDVEQLLAVLREDADGFECCIEIGYDATDTKGNARETAEWVRGEGVETVRLVTSTYHMPRSLLELRHTMPDVTFVPHPVESKKTAMDPWYGDFRSLRLMAFEYSKYLVVLAGG